MSNFYQAAVEFTGNGVIAQNIFYPYWIAHLNASYEQVDCQIKQNYLAICRAWFTLKQVAGDTGEMIYWGGYYHGLPVYIDKWNIDTPPAAGFKGWHYERKYEIVLDQGMSMIWETLNPFSAEDIYVQYAEIPPVDPSQPKFVETNCDIIDWIRGECVKWEH